MELKLIESQLPGMALVYEAQARLTQKDTIRQVVEMFDKMPSIYRADLIGAEIFYRQVWDVIEQLREASY